MNYRFPLRITLGGLGEAFYKSCLLKTLLKSIEMYITEYFLSEIKVDLLPIFQRSYGQTDMIDSDMWSLRCFVM